jgi:hypothetical protein
VLGVKKSRAHELVQAGVLPVVRLSPRRSLVPVSALESMEREALDRARAVQDGLQGGDA